MSSPKSSPPLLWSARVLACIFIMAGAFKIDVIASFNPAGYADMMKVLFLSHRLSFPIPR